jgi:hypothetical protein
MAPAFARAGPLKTPPGIAGPKDRQRVSTRVAGKDRAQNKDECGPVKRIAADDWDLAEGCKDEWADTVGWNIE